VSRRGGAKQGTETGGWVEASIWTERMLAALGNGVKGGKSVNPMLRGWFGYFKHANPYVFKSVDGFIRRRLRAILRKQQKRPGMGHYHADHKRWPNAYFAEHKLFTMTEAHALARRSRC
jgi:hypothetical protein